MRRWGLLTNHAVILIHVIQHSRSTVREIALACGITERAALSILSDLRSASIVNGVREGRRNVYSVNFDTLALYRRAGTAAALLPNAFVAELVKELLRLSGRGSRPKTDQQPQNIAFLRQRAPTTGAGTRPASVR